MRKWTRTPPPGARVLSAGDEDLTEPFSPCHVICRTQLSQRPHEHVLLSTPRGG